MSESTPTHPTTRRQMLAAAGALAGAAGLQIRLVRPANAQRQANPAELALAIRKVTGGAEVQKGKVKLEIPPLSENGNSVPLTVAVDSPMTKDNHVKAIHVFTEKNPQPHVVSAQFGPRSGKAWLQTRFRLADTQTVTAIAQLSDGTFWSDTADVIITLGACLEDNLI